MRGPASAPHGAWASPITAELVSGGAGGVVLVELALDGEDIYWVEMRPAEGARYVVMRKAPDGASEEVTAAPHSARSRVHEYGGGALQAAGGRVTFTNYADQQLYVVSAGSEPRPLSAAPARRFADAIFDERRGRLIAVAEDHGGEGEPRNMLVHLSLERSPADAEGGRVLAAGRDFYSSPCLSPDGRRLAWLSWDHPDMPWDAAEVWCAEVASEGALVEPRHLAGGPGESTFQPAWSPDGVLHFVSDRGGWWNLYRWGEGGAEPLCAMEAEFGRPQWILGMATYGFAGGGRIVCACKRRGRWFLNTLDSATGELSPLGLGAGYSDLDCLRVGSGRAAMIAATPDEPAALIRLPLSGGEPEVVRRSIALALDKRYLSPPRAIEFPTEGGRTAHGFFYPPANPDYRAPEGERPPLLVKSHGGPTSATSDALRLVIQFWTSRGFAVLDVNYGGSSGYGRAYRGRLEGRWGVVDLEDCVNGARHLAAEGAVDASRLCIDGASAGGYTTLCALTFTDAFRAGASYYGIGDLEALARDTHKFEAHYLDRLIGPYPERKDLYEARSPIRFTQRLSCPVIFFQGLDDKVVPPAQAEAMVASLRAKGLPVAYLAFAGEQHGFRRAETVRRALEAELYFFGRVLGFTPADPIEPVEIANL